MLGACPWCWAERVQAVQEQVKGELELELIVAALTDDGRLVVENRLGHFRQVRVAALQLADQQIPGLRVAAPLTSP